MDCNTVHLLTFQEGYDLNFFLFFPLPPPIFEATVLYQGHAKHPVFQKKTIKTMTQNP